jgi:hypothetical protein
VRAALDDHYVLVHDLYLPGGEGDDDAVPSGPHVLAIEIETYAWTARGARGLRWEYLSALVAADLPSSQRAVLPVSMPQGR